MSNSSCTIIWSINKFLSANNKRWKILKSEKKPTQNFGYLIRWKCDWCWIITCADTAIAFNLATEWPPSSGDFIIKPLTVRFCPTYIILSTAYVWPFLSLSTILWWCNLHGSHLYKCWKMDSYVPHSQLLTLFFRACVNTFLNCFMVTYTLSVSELMIICPLTLHLIIIVVTFIPQWILCYTCYLTIVYPTQTLGERWGWHKTVLIQYYGCKLSHLIHQTRVYVSPKQLFPPSLSGLKIYYDLLQFCCLQQHNYRKFFEHTSSATKKQKWLQIWSSMIWKKTDTTSSLICL